MSIFSRKLQRLAGAGSAALLAVFILAFPAAAETYTANNATDLIAKIEAANANGEADIINLQAGNDYTLTIPYTISGATLQTTRNGLPMINSAITINGNGAAIKRSDAAGTPAFRILQVTETGSLTLNSVSISNGGKENGPTAVPTATADSLKSQLSNPTSTSGASGGGINNAGTLVINNCTLYKNFSNDLGGAIVNEQTGSLEINASVIRDNLGLMGGGIASDGSVVCTDTVISGNLSLMGCGLLNFAGTMTLNNCIVKENRFPFDISAPTEESFFPSGGGILNLSVHLNSSELTIGVLEINDSTIQNNLVLLGGGLANGLATNDSYIFGGDVTINRTTISGNVGVLGAGLSNIIGSVKITNSTISGNVSDLENLPSVNLTGSILDGPAVTGGSSLNFGGGCMNLGAMQLNHCTVTGNRADAGAGIFIFGQHITLSGNEPPPILITQIKNTIVAGNIVPEDGAGPDCFGEFYSYGFNLVGTLPGDSGDYIFRESLEGTDLPHPGTCIFGVDPLLGPLQDNGGPTFTHALAEESPAINAGDCLDFDDSSEIGEDQRGEPRPYLYDGICDIGAYEYPSPDGTGVPPEVQKAGPNSGDGNGDGIPDYRQRTVASLSAAGGGDYLTIEVSGCDQVSRVTASAAPEDPDYVYPFGLIAFEINCPSATVRVYYHGAEDVSSLIYRKYGPMPEDWNTPTWYDMPGVTYGTREIDGETVPYAEFTLTEGALGDDTKLPPIIDAGGPAAPQAGIPTLNEWGMIGFMLLLAGLGWYYQRRRHATRPHIPL